MNGSHKTRAWTVSYIETSSEYKLFLCLINNEMIVLYLWFTFVYCLNILKSFFKKILDGSPVNQIVIFLLKGLRIKAMVVSYINQLQWLDSVVSSSLQGQVFYQKFQQTVCIDCLSVAHLSKVQRNEQIVKVFYVA